MPMLGRTALAAGLLLSSIACFPRVSLANASCPCAPGHTCCAESQTCVADGQGCANSSALSVDNLSVQITWPLAISKPRGSGPVDVHFRVNGCDDFTVESVYDSPVWNDVQHGQRAPRHLPVAVEHTKNDYVTHLNFGDLDTGCYTSTNNPFDGDLRLKATCADGRSAVSASVPLQFAITVDDIFLGTVSKEWALERDNHLLVVGPDMIATWRQGPDGRGYTRGQNVSVAGAPWSHFAQQGDVGYLSVGCPLVDCGKTALPDGAGEVPITYVYVLDLGGELYDRDPIVKDVIHVAGRVEDLIPDQDGSVGVVSVVYNDDDPYTESVVVSRIRNKAANVEFYWPNEMLISMPPGNYGQLHHDVFATMESGTNPTSEDILIHSLYTDDRFTLLLPQEERAANRSGDCTRHPDFFFAPGGREWLLRGCTTQVGSVNKPWAKLPVDTERRAPFYPLWTPNSIVMPTGFDKVDFVARSDQHEPIFTYVAADGGMRPPLVTPDGRIILHGGRDGLHFFDDFGTSLGTLSLGEQCAWRAVKPLNGNLLALTAIDQSMHIEFVDMSAASTP